VKSKFEKDLEAQVRAKVAKILNDLDAYNGYNIAGLDDAEDGLVKMALELY